MPQSIDYKEHFWPIFILVLFSVLLFTNTLKNTFIWDDWTIVAWNPYLKDLSNVLFFFSPEFTSTSGFVYRPITFITLAIDHNINGENPFGYHLTNLILHTITVALVYILSLKLLDAAGKKTQPGKLDNASSLFFNIPFICALLFAAHPIHTETIDWVKNRSELLYFMFFTLTLMFYSGILNHKKPHRGYTAYICSFIFFLCALCSKETGVIIPVILVCFAIYFFPVSRLKASLFLSVPFFIASGLFTIAKITLFKTPSANIPTLGFYRHFLLVIKSYGEYLAMLISPVTLNIDRVLITPRSFFEPATFFSTIALGTILIFSIKAFKRLKLASFSLLWILVTILPFSNIVRLVRPIAEQRAYAPSFGFCLLAALCLISVSRLEYRFLRRKIFYYLSVFATVIILLLYSGLTLNRNLDWKTSLGLWKKTITASGKYVNPRAYVRLGRAYNALGLHSKAFLLQKLAVKQDPKPLFLTALGTTCTKLDNNELALQYLNKALAFSKNSWSPLWGSELFVSLGDAFIDIGETQKAINAYKVALASNAFYPYKKLGEAYTITGDLDLALKMLKKSLELFPNNPDTNNAIGITYISLGETGKAIEAFKRAISIDPYTLASYKNLGKIYYNNGDMDNALFYYETALGLAPLETDLCITIADINTLSGNPEKAKEIYKEIISKKDWLLKNAPDNPQIYNALGTAYSQGNEKEKAIEIFTKAIENDPDNAESYYKIGEIYVGYRDLKKAETYYKQAINKNPEYAPAYYQLSVIYYSRGDYDLSVEYCDEAVSLGYKNPELIKVLEPYRKQ